MKKIYLILVCFIWTSNTLSQQAAIESFGAGFDRPVNIKNAGDDRLFVVEQDGVIQILNADGSTNGTPFLDIQSLVVNIGGINDERGLLGLVFHPNYLGTGTGSGLFFVNYINPSGNTVIARYSVNAGDSNLADPSSAEILLTITQPATNHNGGDMAFGPDGYLYIATGDGGGAEDPDNYGQRLNTLLGKMLRIDVDNGLPYTIPSDNPFENDGDVATLGEIWAYGLRNPWKFSFDSLTNDLWIADVGQYTYEEINMVASNLDGLNYGWRCREGAHDFNTTGCPGTGYTEPVGEYAHGGSPFKCSITGGYRYRGSVYSNFTGLYFFADYCSGEIGFLEYNGSSWDMTLNTIAGGGSWSAFGEDVNGELYVASLTTGQIYKLVDGSLSVEEFDLFAFKMYPNPTNNDISFNFSNNLPQHINFFDIQGKLALEVDKFNSNTFNIPISSLSKGLYIVEVLNTDGSRTHKKLVIY